MLRTVAFSLLMASTGFASAQVLTPEEILALVNEKVQVAGPYAELLNDPDPARQLAAIQIMMGTGDAGLVAMAAESGFQASDPSVRQKTLESYLATKPTISINIDGAAAQSGNFEVNTRRVGASVSADGLASVTYAVGEFDTERRCYVHRAPSAKYCFIQVSNGGVEVVAPEAFFTFQGKLSESGTLVGSTSVYNVTGGFPTSVQLVP